jgi:hypothetical protein
MAVLAALLAAPSAAQIRPIPIVQLVGDVTEDSVQLGLTMNKESRSTPRRITWTLPRGVRVSPKGFAHCSPYRASQLNCPRRARVATGRMTVVVGKDAEPVTYEVSVFADGPRMLTFALRSPDVEVERHVAIRGRTLRLPIARAIRTTFADTYLTNFSLALGPARAQGRAFVRPVGCPAGGYQYAVEVKLPKTTAGATAQSDCR